MQSRVLSFDSVAGQFVAGMSWRHETRKPGGARLRELAADLGQWGLVRRGAEGAYQAGFCMPLEGVQKPSKAVSLAAAVADVNVAPWRGWFDLGDGYWWYVAVAHGDEVLPEGDRICNAVQLAELRAQHEGYFAWREVEGSLQDLEELAAVSGARSTPLRDFAPSFGSMLKRRGFKRPSMGVMAGIAALVVALGGGTAFLVHERRVKTEQAAAVEKARKFAEMRKNLEAKSTPTPPWLTMPMPGAVFEACREGWKGQDLARAGWALVAWKCTPGAAGVELEEDWERAGGRALNAPGTLEANGESSKSSRSVAVAWAMPMPASAAGAEVVELLTPDVAQRRAHDMRQRYGEPMKLVIGGVKRAATPPGAEKEPPPPWMALTVTWTVTLAPWFGFGDPFDELPGMRVTSVRYDAKKGASWTLEGQLYASTGVVGGNK